MTTCKHNRVKPVACDQTLGIVCLDCNFLIAECWYDDHIPESLWNKACMNDADAIPSEQNRDNVCALCGEEFSTRTREEK